MVHRTHQPCPHSMEAARGSEQKLQIMKSILIITLSLITIGSLIGQNKAWISSSPCGANEVNGLMINIFPNKLDEEKKLLLLKA